MFKLLVGTACLCVIAVTACIAYSVVNGYIDDAKARRISLDCSIRFGEYAGLRDECLKNYGSLLLKEDKQQTFRDANRDALNASAI